VSPPKEVVCGGVDVGGVIVVGVPVWYWNLGKHIHNDHITGVVVHHKAKHVSPHMIGIEVHGVIVMVELKDDTPELYQGT